MTNRTGEEWFTAPASQDPNQSPVRQASETVFCRGCNMIHSVELTCAVVKARVEALIVEEGELLGEEEIGDCDRPALLSALRLRGLALEPEGDRWRVVAVLS